MSTGSDLISLIASRQNLDGLPEEALDRHASPNTSTSSAAIPKVTRTAYQRLYDMILSYGTEEIVVNKEKLIRYKFFDDPDDQRRGRHLRPRRTLMSLVNVLKSAAHGYGTERRVLLLHGPVGSSKSTIARLLKKGLEQLLPHRRRARSSPSAGRSRDADGERGLRRLPDARGAAAPDPRTSTAPRFSPSSIDEPPTRRLPRSPSRATSARSAARCSTSGCERYDGDWTQGRSSDVRVRRLILSEQDRIGIGTFQPKDEKNQDATELTGDINYRKIAEYGTDSDPRAFNFDGEFNIANRGIIEFIEVLKLDVAFLYDLLGASQEHKIKPKKFAQTDIDEVIIGHTNEPEYKKLQTNEFMEALRDRTVKIDVPYVTRLTDEIKIYEKDYNSRKVRGKRHRAAHARGGGDVGGAHPAGGAQERRPDADAEAQALQRQDPARLHRGQHQGTARGGRARGDARHQPALRPGQDLQRPGRRPRRALDQPVHGPQRAGGRPQAPLADQQRGDRASTTGTCSPS